MAAAKLVLKSFAGGPILSTPSAPNTPTPTTSSSFSSSSFFPISKAISSPPPLRSSASRLPHNYNPLPKEPAAEDPRQQQHKTILVETFHRNNCLKALLGALSRKGSNPVRLLGRDGDWTHDQLWAAVTFLVEAGRAQEALQVFDFWKSKEMTRINDANYSRIIQLLCEGCLMEEAVSTLQDMEKYGLVPSLAIYNAIIHGFARDKDFDNSSTAFKKMLEAGLLPTPETYNGLIQAYGSYGLYDEMSKCVKRMESDGCFPNKVTYNILITELARGGLIERMERIYKTLRSKRMNLQSSTLIAMLEAYADLGILEKIEKVYRRVMNSKAYMKECLIRKLATVYIKNYRFSYLEELGNDISARSGRTDLVWCILLLCSACLLSRRGMESIIQEMKVAKVRFNTTFTNILAMFYLKMKDFRSLDAVFSQAGKQNVKPDIFTVGVLFDACKIGYNGTHVIEEWIKNGSLEEVVEIKTDNLVLIAFGRGSFIKHCEKLYSSLESEAEQKKVWRYSDLISLVFGKSQKELASAS
ncbi:pentatricopeptide repeat-containing protein At4g14190, chloroplastic [Phoenix dactylifera]|uniref:Pentatricopeptide repeat-containing protein At4g14190, chloroplastic n=1 Tax=Phoenix dactylifera TaxID=42345 RepID=A0A8B7D279_PHODC|nr:pentatricopeptide repeat-containing protein At4g14190, chloroplastic [Phoenix dactylifera]